MAQVNSKFSIGDDVVTVDKGNLKMKKFKVAEIAFFLYKDSLSIYLYPMGEDGRPESSNGVNEECCFASETDLIEHMTTK